MGFSFLFGHFIERQLYSTQAQSTRHKSKDITPPIARKRDVDRDTTSGYKAKAITPPIAWKRDRDTTSGYKAKDITPPIAWKRDRDTTSGHKARTSHHRSPGRETETLPAGTKQGHQTTDRLEERQRHYQRVQSKDITPPIAWKRDRDTTSGHKTKDITPPIAWRREAWKEEALDDLPRQGEKGHIIY